MFDYNFLQQLAQNQEISLYPNLRIGLESKCPAGLVYNCNNWDAYTTYPDIARAADLMPGYDRHIRRDLLNALDIYVVILFTEPRVKGCFGYTLTRNYGFGHKICAQPRIEEDVYLPHETTQNYAVHATPKWAEQPNVAYWIEQKT